MLLLFAFCLFLGIIGAYAQQNITVNATDSSISLENTSIFSECVYNSNGTISTDLATCRSLFPSGCAGSFALSQSENATASFKFNGSAIYLNSIKFAFDTTYAITLDGKTTEVNSTSTSIFGVCSVLWSETGLDPAVEHEVHVATQGALPLGSTIDIDDIGPIDLFGLVSFVYTSAEGSTTNSSQTTQSDNGALKNVRDSSIFPLVLGISFVLF